MAKMILREEANLLWTDDPAEKEKQKNKNKKQQIDVVPTEHELSIRPEKKGRGGKVVSVIYDFPVGSEDYFKKLTKKLKRECGSGGTYKVDSIEVQGDHREKIKVFLESLGFKVKFTGG
jgi:translation initiation factor 1